MSTNVGDGRPTSFRRIIGLCHPIRDLNFALSPAELRVATQEGLIPRGVQFCDETEFLDRRAALNVAYSHRRDWGSGGPVSNSLYAAALQMGPYPRASKIEWSGPVGSAGRFEHVDPLSSLRSVGVRIDGYRDRGSGVYESICVVNSNTGETEGIFVGPRPSERQAIPEVSASDLLIVKLAEIGQLRALLKDGPIPSIAVVAADLPQLAAADADALGFFSTKCKLRFFFCRWPDLDKLHLLESPDSVRENLAGCEVVATNGSEPVRVFANGCLLTHELQVVSIAETSRSLLGAGDAYAGAYIAVRSQGGSIETAHSAGENESRMASYSTSARRVFDVNLTALFGKVIQRQSSTADWFLTDRVRQNCGLTILSCGNSGIDTFALAASQRLGLAGIAVMPSGRRREGEDSDVLGSFYSDLGRRIADDAVPWRVIELGTNSYRYCTWANVYLSDATVLFDIGGGEGSRETRRACSILDRPLFEVGPDGYDRASLMRFIERFGVRVLNIAGSRQSLIPLELLKEVEELVFRVVWDATAVFATDGPPSAPDLSDLKLGGCIGLPRFDAISRLVDKPLRRSGAGAVGTASSLFVEGLEGDVCFGRSYDLVRMVDLGVIDAAFVGSDMVSEYGEGNYTVWGRLGIFNCLVSVVAPSSALFSPRALVAQYPSLAERHFAGYGADIVPIRGSSEGWIASGKFDGAVDTWRTGRTAAEHGLEFVEGVESTSLCLIFSAQPSEWAVRACSTVWNYLISRSLPGTGA